MTLLKNIALFLLSFILFPDAKAQVIYTDLNPDIVKTSWDSYHFHLEKADSGLNSPPYLGEFILCKHPGDIAINAYDSSAQVLMVQENGSYYPVKLSSGDSIDVSAGIWQQPAYNILADGATGKWLGAVDGYLGLRFKKSQSSQWYYGWARLDVSGNLSKFTLKDYAYNDSAAYPILAGQKVFSYVGIAEVSTSSLTPGLYPVPVKDQLIINLPGGIYQIEVRTLYGQLLRFYEGRTQICIIPLGHALARGEYIVIIRSTSELNEVFTQAENLMYFC